MCGRQHKIIKYIAHYATTGKKLSYVGSNEQKNDNEMSKLNEIDEKLKDNYESIQSLEQQIISLEVDDQSRIFHTH